MRAEEKTVTPENFWELYDQVKHEAYWDRWQEAWLGNLIKLAWGVFSRAVQAVFFWIPGLIAVIITMSIYFEGVSATMTAINGIFPVELTPESQSTIVNYWIFTVAAFVLFSLVIKPIKSLSETYSEQVQDRFFYKNVHLIPRVSGERGLVDKPESNTTKPNME